MADIVEEGPHGRAGMPPVRIIQIPARQLLLPVAEQFNNAALFEIGEDIVLKQMSDSRSRNRRLAFVVR